MLVHDEDTVRREFQILSKLVQRTACYRLHFGQDMLDLPHLISPLFERHCPSLVLPDVTFSA